MTLGQLMAGAKLRAPLPEEAAALEVLGLDYDSRRTGEKYVFFAFHGARSDGREFAEEARRRGAVATVSELPRHPAYSGLWIEVEEARRAMAVAAKRFYDSPDERLTLTGVTGTNGKTTTTFLLDSILRAAGLRTALISTIEYQVAGEVRPAVNTTPESLDLHRLFSELAQKAGSHATMEVSSHALALGRVHGLRFHTAVFTNLTQDHLDFHSTMEDYFAAKDLLFRGAGAPPPRFAVVNQDDPASRRLRTSPETSVLRYGLRNGAGLRPIRVSSGFDGLRFEICHEHGRIPVRSSMLGGMNVYNILAACGAALTLGISPEAISAGISACHSVPGRFERIQAGQPYLVIVDYAHTDNALRNLIAAARELDPKRVITVFGCGGDRDRSKRPHMAEAAAEGSDFVILTSDNPRTEEPLNIINDALVGLRRHNVRHAVEPDRGRAIRLGLEEARRGDIVLIAGKGHETYQILGDKVVPFDDRAVARGILRELGYGEAQS